MEDLLKSLDSVKHVIHRTIFKKNSTNKNVQHMFYQQQMYLELNLNIIKYLKKEIRISLKLDFDTQEI